MGYPGDQDPPSRGEWWRPDPGYPTPAQGSPEAPRAGADSGQDRGYRGGYGPGAGRYAADGGQNGGSGLGPQQPGGYSYGERGASPYGDGAYRRQYGRDAGGRGSDTAPGGYGPAQYSAGGDRYPYASAGYGDGYTRSGYDTAGNDTAGNDTDAYDVSRFRDGGHEPGEYSASGGHGSGGQGSGGYGSGGYQSGGYGPGGYQSGGYGSGGYGSGPGDTARGRQSDRTGYAQPGSGYGAAPGGGSGGGYRAAAFGYQVGAQPEPGDRGRRGGPLQAPVPSTGSRDPARGFPPPRGAGSPAYPPGQFSAWNTPPDEQGGSPNSMLAGGMASAGGGGPGLGRGTAIGPASGISPASETGTGSAAGFATTPGTGTSPAFGDAAFADSAFGDPAFGDPAGDSAYAQGAARNAASAGDAPGALGVASGFRDPFGRKGSTAVLADDEDSAGWGYGQASAAAVEGLAGEADASAQAGTWVRRGQGGSDGSEQGNAWTYPEDGLASPAAPPTLGGSGRAAKRRGARPPRARRKLLMVAIAVVVVAALGGTAVYALTGHGKPVAARSAPPTQAQASKPQPSPSPTLGKWQHIGTRAEDPVPLTLAELYPATVSSTGQSYSRAAERMDTNCPHAVFGTALKTATHKGKCTQVARASYVSGDGKLMGTIGVLNLINYQAATRVGKVVGSNEFIGPLKGSRGPTRNIAKGTGLVQAEIKGHYLILTWAEYANLHKPSKSHDRSVLVAFSNELIQLTANRSLTNRMVTGQPRT